MNKFIKSAKNSTKVVCALLCLQTFVLLGCTDSLSSLYSNPRNSLGAGPAPLNLPNNSTSPASASSYAILSKTGITNVTGSSITGNLGVSPAAESYITGFGLTADSSNVFSRSSSVTGKVFASDNAVPTPSNLTTAVGSMERAYTDGMGRIPADYNELATGNIGGLTLAPGLYKWGTSVTIPTDTTLSGGPNDVWIFQVAGDLVMSAAKNVILIGGAQAKNVYWIVAGQVTIGTTSHFEGTILCKTSITLQTSASMRGRALSQTAVALDNNTIVMP